MCCFRTDSFRADRTFKPQRSTKQDLGTYPVLGILLKSPEKQPCLFYMGIPSPGHLHTFLNGSRVEHIRILLLPPLGICVSLCEAQEPGSHPNKEANLTS